VSPDRQKYLERQRRYNQSERGLARYARYREEHRFEIRDRDFLWRIYHPLEAYEKDCRRHARDRLQRRNDLYGRVTAAT
jgi:hypothetical protein